MDLNPFPNVFAFYGTFELLIGINNQLVFDCLYKIYANFAFLIFNYENKKPENGQVVNGIRRLVLFFAEK